MISEHDYDKYPELTNAQLADFGFDSPHVQYTEDFDARVVRVRDGDTVVLSTPERDFAFPLRLLDVDAREMNEGGQEAKSWLKARVEGRDVRIHINPKKRVGKYGRLLGRIISDGLDVSEEMMFRDLVVPFDKRDEGKIPPLSKIYQEGEIAFKFR